MANKDYQKLTLYRCELRLLGVSLDPQEHFVGETVHLQCGQTSSSPVFWDYKLDTRDDDYQYIISGDKLTDGDRVKQNGSTLIIKNAKTNDSGIYSCIGATNGEEVKYQVRLDVYGKHLFLSVQFGLVWYTVKHKVLRGCKPAGRDGFLSHTVTVL